MKTFLTAILFISIAFSVFILNKDFSVKSVNDDVVVDEAQASLVQQHETGFSNQTYAKEAAAQPSELESDNTQHLLNKAKGETEEERNDSFSQEKLITWVNDKEALAELDEEMGLIEPTEYDQMLLESELNSAKHSIQNTETVRSIALSDKEPIFSNHPELEGVMLEEELPSTSTMDQY
ncbi:hypothetical protein [Alteromonas australica]|uniref:hypothetical protein n=1 Tax=Alteromonas australica TaxID=589873 RepID=UPI000C97535F|nr:hypothetical protein [Alteromonas australica]MAC45236.1 hypothetical protein [Oceanospirillum sp.]|tara:strand:- start:8500 stop:9036 length:537 start_codon:yes stop_codon:yes gene_type:complete